MDTIDKGTIDADVDFAKRRAEGAPDRCRKIEGTLYHYRKAVASASLGAIIKTRD